MIARMSAEIHKLPVAALAPLIRAQMPAGRRACRMPDAVVQAAVEHGLFRLWIPRRYGGFECSLPEALGIYEAAARMDGSFGWAVMIGSGGGLFAAYLEPERAQRVFGPRAAVVAGSGAPTGFAERIPGGYRATGRWKYASGADYATMGGKAIVAAGAPQVRAMAFEPADVAIHRTWDTSGLRATGSHDISVTDVFVPESATFSVMDDRPREPGPLYRLPFETLTGLPVSAVVLGVALQAVAEFESLARSKPAPGGTTSLDHVGAVRVALRSAQDRLGAARCAVLDCANAVWARVIAGERPGPQACRQVCVDSVRQAVRAVAELVPYAGMNAIHCDDAFGVAWRDLETVAAHFSVSPLNLSGES
jgi:indole-3-acetate monooxygenase